MKHLEQMFLVGSPSNERRGLGEKSSGRQRAMEVLRQEGVFLGPRHRERPSHKHRRVGKAGWFAALGCGAVHPKVLTKTK